MTCKWSVLWCVMLLRWSPQADPPLGAWLMQYLCKSSHQVGRIMQGWHFLVVHLHRGMKWDRPISPHTWRSLHLYQHRELEISSLWPIQSVIRHGPESGPCLITYWMAQLNVRNQYSCQGALAHSGYMGAPLCRHKRNPLLWQLCNCPLSWISICNLAHLLHCLFIFLAQHNITYKVYLCHRCPLTLGLCDIFSWATKNRNGMSPLCSCHSHWTTL